MENRFIKFQTENLFLLVGSNPLPDYVAARLLSQPGGNIFLLHSAGVHGTINIAERLEKALSSKMPDVSIHLYEIDEADGNKISRKISEIFREVPMDRGIGLNYTGGTKSMAVHAYRAIESHAKDAVFSYLDARNLAFCFDRWDSGKPTTFIPILVEDISIPIETILELHGIHPDPIKRYAQLGDVAIPLLEANTYHYDAWRKWCASLKKPDNNKFYSKSELRKIPIPGAEFPEAHSVFQKLDSESHASTLGDLYDSLCATDKNISINSFAKYLDGEWLDYFTLSCIRKIAADCRLNDFGMDIKFQQNRRFQFDVVAMRGYQLFAISCSTTNDKRLAKSKLFEVYIRARQMGGDEARIGLVTMYPETEELQSEIDEEWFTEGQVRVFGPDDLEQFPEALTDWFQTGSLTT